MPSNLILRCYFLIAGVIGRICILPYIILGRMSLSCRVLGWRSVRLEPGVLVAGGTWLNVNKPRCDQIIIRSRSLIGRNNFFTTGKKIVIREYCLTGANCAFIGATHVVSNPLRPYIGTGVQDLGDIYVGVNVFIGYGATLMGGVSIGHGSVVGAGACVRQSIPPFSVVVGNPAKVIKRYCFERSKWIDSNAEAPLSAFPDEDSYLSQLKLNDRVRMPYIIGSEIFNSTY